MNQPLVLRPESVQTVQVSDHLVHTVDPRPFYDVQRDAHPPPIVIADVRPFHAVERDAHPKVIPARDN